MSSWQGRLRENGALFRSACSVCTLGRDPPNASNLTNLSNASNLILCATNLIEVRGQNVNTQKVPQARMLRPEC